MSAKKAAKQTVPTRPIQLGDRVRGKITGYTGICDAIMVHLYQCRQVHIMPEDLDRDGNVKKGEWVDEPWCEIVAPNVFAPLAAVEGFKGERVSGAPDRAAVRDLQR